MDNSSKGGAKPAAKAKNGEVDGDYGDDLGPDDLPENQTLRWVFESNKEEGQELLFEIKELIGKTEIVGDGDAVANRPRQALRRAQELCSRLEAMQSLKRMVRRI